MLRRILPLFFVAFLALPSTVRAGFFLEDPVKKALDDYETNRDTARRQMTVEPDRSVSDKKENPSRPVQAASKTGKERRAHETEFGFESYAYQYQETVGGERFMRLKGVFYGIYLTHTFRPNQLDPFYGELMDFFRFEGRVAWARLDYDGGVQNGLGERVADLTTQDIPDIVFETRILMGKDFDLGGISLTPYSGLGFRFLKDDPSDVYGTFTYESVDYELNGYMRKSYYYYLPIGIDIRKPLGDSWQIGFNAEYDYFLHGFQKSYVPLDNNRVLTNFQNKGYGLRSSVRLTRNTPGLSFSVEPYMRFWDIENSEWVQTGDCIPDVGCPGGLEPSNITREVGVKMGMTF
jgi:hypothetical protein